MVRSLYEADNSAEGERGQMIVDPQGTKPVTAQPEQAVKRNAGQFPEGFMFVLTPQGFAEWRSQFVTSKADRMGPRHAPMALTEQGIAMLSSVLKSEPAVQVNIEIMRALVRLRELIATNKNLARRLDELEKKYDTQFKVVFDAIRELMAPPPPRRRRVGFRVEEARPICGRPRHRRTKGAR